MKNFPATDEMVKLFPQFTRKELERTQDEKTVLGQWPYEGQYEGLDGAAKRLDASRRKYASMITSLPIP